MSVVIATPDNYDTIRKTILHLRKQTICDSLEVIIVAPSRFQLNLQEADLSVFASWQVIEIGALESIGRANATGIRRAVAPIVALAEDHCFPDPEWAESLLTAHQDSWAAVGPGVRNANPSTAVSWADLFIGYGPWLLPTSAREVDFLPGHNSSYKRDILLSYGNKLPDMMDSETVLHWDLRAKGHRLYLEPAAKVAHTNFGLWSSWIPVQFYNGRLFAGSRVRGMSFFKRVVYVLGAPMIPFVRLARITRQLRSVLLLKKYMRCLHALVIGLLLDGLGQMLGYLAGAGNAVTQVARFEFHRVDHITEGDRETISFQGR